MYHWILKIILWENQRSWVISLWALLITDRDKSRILLFSSSLCMSSTVLYVTSLCECRRHCDIVPRCPFRNEGLIHVSARSTADSCPQVSVPSMYYVDWRKLPWSRSCLVPVADQHGVWRLAPPLIQPTLRLELPIGSTEASTETAA